jgi:glycosyltransferase involved in cell wall biosynthesis
MRCPTLAELPPPPRGRTGWPWTIESSPFPPIMLDGEILPKISIVTPSYNQGPYIEETIRSVLLQGYTDLEYIIMDGGSTDESVSIIKKYERWLTHWQSAPDGGQVSALNSGFAKTTGVILNWLNSDDFLQKDALLNIARAFQLRPDVDIITGFRAECSVSSDPIAVDGSWQRRWGYYHLGIPEFPQDATFLSRETFISALPFDERLNFYFDTAFYYRVLRKKRRYVFLYSVVSSIRVYPEMKSLRHDDRKATENEILNSEYLPKNFVSRIVSRLQRTRFYFFVWACIQHGFVSAGDFRIMRYNYTEGRWELVPVA